MQHSCFAYDGGPRAGVSGYAAGTRPNGPAGDALADRAKGAAIDVRCQAARR